MYDQNTREENFTISMYLACSLQKTIFKALILHVRKSLLLRNWERKFLQFVWKWWANTHQKHWGRTFLNKFLTFSLGSEYRMWKLQISPKIIDWEHLLTRKYHKWLSRAFIIMKIPSMILKSFRYYTKNISSKFSNIFMSFLICVDHPLKTLSADQRLRTGRKPLCWSIFSKNVTFNANVVFFQKKISHHQIGRDPFIQLL